MAVAKQAGGISDYSDMYVELTGPVTVLHPRRPAPPAGKWQVWSVCEASVWSPSLAAQCLLCGKEHGSSQRQKIHTHYFSKQLIMPQRDACIVSAASTSRPVILPPGQCLHLLISMDEMIAADLSECREELI